jgi:flagellar biosynthesis protein FliQ
MAQIQPPTLTLDPKLINFYAEVFMYRNHWVTSDVQFRKGHEFPLFGVGNGYPD